MTLRLPEQRLYDRICRELFADLVLERHEDRYSPDIPDVSFVEKNTGRCGWIELKVLRGWGACSHLLPGQVNWLNLRARLGAPVWLLAESPAGDLLWIPGSRVSHRMRESGFTEYDWRAAAAPAPYPQGG